MIVFIALHDPSDDLAGKSWVVGAFTQEELARAACQADAAIPSRPLEWKDGGARDADYTTYAIIQAELNTAI